MFQYHGLSTSVSMSEQLLEVMLFTELLSFELTVALICEHKSNKNFPIDCDLTNVSIDLYF